MGLTCTPKFIKCIETEHFRILNLAKYSRYIIDIQRYKTFGMYLAILGFENQLKHF